MTLQLELPSDIVDAVHVSGGDPAVTVMQELILGMFQKGTVTGGRAASVLGLSRRGFVSLVKERQITLPLGVADFEAELETLNNLGA